MTDPTPGSVALAALDAVTAALPGREDRPGQLRMAELVADSIGRGRHLVVQAGTGTGKTLAYLVPAIMSGKRTIVATATKALQDQLATKDLPFLAAELAELGHDVDWAVLKGRSNYLCLQRLREMSQPATGQLELEELSPINRLEITKLAEWAGTTDTGDQAELDWSPSDSTWRAVSVGSTSALAPTAARSARSASPSTPASGPGVGRRRGEHPPVRAPRW
jgi:ATP-dependent DNA helicase DinG